jgi:mono/diheme cytochrome c family protein
MKLIVMRGAIALAIFSGGLCLLQSSQARNGSVETINPVNVVDARAVFVRHCANCHGRDGRSKTPKGRQTHARNIADAGWQNDVSDERIFNSINNGRGTKMPRFDKKLSESEIDQLVSYVRQLKR